MLAGRTSSSWETKGRLQLISGLGDILPQTETGPFSIRAAVSSESMLLLTLWPRLCLLLAVHVGVKSYPEKSAMYKYNDYMSTLLKLQYCTLEHLTRKLKKINGWKYSFKTEMNSLTNSRSFQIRVFTVYHSQEDKLSDTHNLLMACICMALLLSP